MTGDFDQEDLALGAVEAGVRNRGFIADATLVRDARDQLFADLGYGGTGGYSRKWFGVKLGRLTIPLPNLPSRVRAVRLHDLHHLATGYETSWIGEAEIGAWELASGCRGYWAARLLDASAFTAGLFLSPRRVFRAFLRGRHSSNLYTLGFDERLLDESLGTLREHMGLRQPTPDARFSDWFSFSSWVLASMLGLVLILMPWLWGLSKLLALLSA